MNSIRSGSCHLANSLPRCSRSSSGLASMPSRRTTAASGRSPHFSSGIGDHRGLGDGAVSHQLVLEVDRGDPFATGLDEILGPIADAHASALVDADDVAGAEPAVVGELVGARPAVVGGGDPGAADLELSHRLVVPGDQRSIVVPSADLDQRDRSSLASAVLVLIAGGRGSPGRRAASTASRAARSPSCPNPGRWSGRDARSSRSGSPEPLRHRGSPAPATRRSHLSGSASIACRTAIHTVGTPAVNVTRSPASRSSKLTGSRRGPGSTSFAPVKAAVYGRFQPLTWNIGTAGKITSRELIPSASGRANTSECSTSARCE